MDKKGNPRPIKFWNGLEDEIESHALKEGRNFTEMVNHLCDRALYSSNYSFPFHKSKFNPGLEESKGKKGR